jgi:ribonuclease P protein component
MLRRDVLRRKEDFSRVYKKGKSVGDRYVVVFALRNQLGYSRISFLASKKVGNSVKRNRARRLMRESVREIGSLPEGYDFIIIARNTINDKKCADVKKSIEAALRRLKIH